MEVVGEEKVNDVDDENNWRRNRKKNVKKSGLNCFKENVVKEEREGGREKERKRNQKEVK